MALARSYTCGLCGLSFHNPMQLGPHVRVCQKKNNVIRFAESDNMQFDSALHASPMQVATQVPTQNQSQLPTQTPEVPTPQVPTQDTNPLVTAQTQLPTPTQNPINMLCMRVGGGPHAVVEDVPLSSGTNIARPNPHLIHNFCATQRLWDIHVQQVYDLCDPSFWKMFEAVKLKSATCVDNVLSACADILAKKNVSITKCWPRTKRMLRQLILRKLGNFWPRVSITKIIDLRNFEIPGDNTHIFHI